VSAGLHPIADVSPLAEIESRVLERAKQQTLDLDGPAATARLRALIEEEVAQWSLDFKHGLRPFDLASPDLVVDRAHRNLTGYGPLEPLLADDDVWEIMINAPDQIFVKRHTGVSGYHDEAFHDDDHVIRTLTKILDDASAAHRKLDPSEGLQDAQLDDGARLHIVHRDVGRDGHLHRQHPQVHRRRVRNLDELVDRGMLTAQVAEFLRAASGRGPVDRVRRPPGSGKTTMLSCCTAELDPTLRVVTAEEVFEVDVPLPNVASMQTRAARPDRPAVDLRRLVAGFLRMAPDVAIVGEVRDREALPLLLTLSSGVKGYTTIHAGSARQACPGCGSSASSPTRGPSCRCPRSTTSSPRRSTSSCTALASTACRGSPRSSRSRTCRPAPKAPRSPSPSCSTGRRSTRARLDRERPGAAAPAARGAGYDVRSAAGPPGPTPVGRWRVNPVIAFLLALARGLRGVPALHVAAFGWRGLGMSPDPPAAHASASGSTTSSSRPASTGSASVEFLAVAAVLFVVGALVAWALFGGVARRWRSGSAAGFPVASARARRPGGSTRPGTRGRDDRGAAPPGRQPRPVDPAGAVRRRPRGPEEMQPAFAAAQREWLISTDFDRTLAVLKAAAGRPDRRRGVRDAADRARGRRHRRRPPSAALIEDRIQDLQGRKDARAKQAGARFARWFVLIVPLGMALVGQSIGRGGARTARPARSCRDPGRARASSRLCWLWAGGSCGCPRRSGCSPSGCRRRRRSC
jgi:pilus assembly protein CpaF